VVACAVAALVGEFAVRLLKPGFPGFRVPQVEHRPVAGLGFEMVPNQSAYTAAEPATINSQGLRGPALRSLRDGSSLRVLCIGDSITFGYGVADEAPFPRQLEHLLHKAMPERDVEVINAGVQRYFTYQEIDFLRLKGRQLRPDIVVLAVYSNDLGVRPHGDYLREYEKEREQAATAFRTRFPLLYALTKNSALVELTKGAYLRSTEGTAIRMFEGVATERDERRWNAMAQELSAFRELSIEHDFFPMVVAVPARVQIQNEFPDSLYPKRVFALARREGLENLDFIDRFRESLARGVDPYLPWDNHLSADGHALVAGAIANRLKELWPQLEKPRHAVTGSVGSD
jgi:lysophospholipase L1-like esterase